MAVSSVSSDVKVVGAQSTRPSAEGRLGVGAELRYGGQGKGVCCSNFGMLLSLVWKGRTRTRIV